jgi:aryl-alcohol dehydrogenase-like predicted oxidoreductase
LSFCVNNLLWPTSRLVFGTGGRFGRLSSQNARSLVHHSWYSGVKSFDTGFHYSRGASQRQLFHAIRPFLGDPDLFISTKLIANPVSLKQNLRETVEALGRSYIDIVFLWGPTIDELNSVDLYQALCDSLNSERVLRFGVNTHDYDVMKRLDDTRVSSLITDVMIDYSMACTDRVRLFPRWTNLGYSIWAGTALAQGYLLEPLVKQFLRAKSFSYLLRGILNKPTRNLRRDATPIRRYLAHHYPSLAHHLPISYVLSSPFIARVPIGMMSHRSIDLNILAERNLPEVAEVCSYLHSIFDRH